MQQPQPKMLGNHQTEKAREHTIELRFWVMPAADAGAPGGRSDQARESGITPESRSTAPAVGRASPSPSNSSVALYFHGFLALRLTAAGSAREVQVNHDWITRNNFSHGSTGFRSLGVSLIPHRCG